MQEFWAATPEETMDLGRRLAGTLAPGDVLAFTGGLGAGKTTLCRGLAQGLGCTDEASSPTYAIVNLYRGPQPLAHFDLYRLQTEDDLETAGFYDYLEEGAVVAVEWSERFALPVPPRATIHMEPAGEGRRILVDGVTL